MMDSTPPDMLRPVRTKPLTVLKCVGPKLVPFFKTVVIYFVLFGESSVLGSYVYCAIKCLPIVSLMVFVLLHGMNFTAAYAYSRKILVGLFFSMVGDACLVWKHIGYFIPGTFFFALAQALYASAFGIRPAFWTGGAVFATIGAIVYSLLLPGLSGPMVFIVGLYLCLILTMAWRAVARVHFYNDLWTWTKLSSCGGALLFMISDLTIAVDKFCFPVPYSHQIIMVTYYAAQLGIACSVVDSQVDDLMEATRPEGETYLHRIRNYIERIKA